VSAADEARDSLDRAFELDSRGRVREAVVQELAVAQVWATLAVAEAIKDAVASTMYQGKP